jgi:hypothetical protein
MRKLILMVGLVVVACSSDGSGVGEEAAELVCRNWCQPDTGSACGSGDPVSCLNNCISQAQQPCGEHEHAKKGCQLEMGCEDPFEDCGTHDQDRTECNRGITEKCGAECPEQAQLCYYARGDCALARTCAESCPRDPQYCASNGGECGLQDRCFQQCPESYNQCLSEDGQCP